MRKADIRRFWSKVSISESGCWIWTACKVEARSKVLDLMHKNGLSRYQYDDDHVVELIPGQEKVKVKPVAAESETDVNED